MTSSTRCARVERRAPPDQLGQRLARDVLHGDERLAVVLADVVDGDDVRVLQPRREPRLALEALADVGVVDAQHLDRDEAIDGRIEREEERAHAALAEALADVIAIDGRRAASWRTRHVEGGVEERLRGGDVAGFEPPSRAGEIVRHFVVATHRRRFGSPKLAGRPAVVRGAVVPSVVRAGVVGRRHVALERPQQLLRLAPAAGGDARRGRRRRGRGRRR